MKPLILSAILLGLAGVGTQRAQAEQRITIDACNGVDARAVDRILDLEYHDAGQGPLLVGLTCEGDNLTLRVRRANSPARVLVVDLSAVLAVAKPRTVALLIVELSSELALGLVPEPPMPAALAPAPAAPEIPIEAQPSAAPFVAVEPIANPPEPLALLGGPGSEQFSAAIVAADADEGRSRSPIHLGSPRLSGALGYSMVSQNFSTPDTCSMCNYNIQIGAPSAIVGAKISGRYGSRYLFAADVDYQYAESQLHMVNESVLAMVDTGVQQHRFRAGARAGYQVDKPSAIAAYARVGAQHERFIIENQDFDTNTAKLPSELLSGITIGAMLEFAKLTAKASLSVNADMLVVGRLVQTTGLSDGQFYSTKASYLGAKLDYQWTSSVNFTWNYNYSQQSTQWYGVDPTSLREHDGGTATRTDHVHSLFAGLSKSI